MRNSANARHKGFRRIRGQGTLCFCLWVLACGALFAGLPALLLNLPVEQLTVSLWLLIWVLCPAVSLPSAWCVAGSGVPALLAWLPAPVGYLLLPLWGMRPEWSILLLSIVIGVMTGVAAEQWRGRREKKR